MPEKESAPDQPTPDSPQTSEQVSDSGIRNNEVPVDVFDKTSLAQAHALGLISTNQDLIAALVPAQTSTVANEPSATEQKAPTNKMTIGKRIGIAGVAVAAGTALVVGAVFASKAGSDTSKNAAPLKSPIEASQSPQPSATEAIPKSPNFTELIAAQEIKSGQTPEALASDVNDRLGKWEMAGTDTFKDDYKAEVTKTGDGSDASRYKFANDYARAQYINIFGSALYGLKPGYAVEPQLQIGIDKMIAINSLVLELHWFTSSGLTSDLAPYARGISEDSGTPVSVGHQYSDTTTLFMNFIEFDNSNLNRAASVYAANRLTGPNGNRGGETVILKESGGVERITLLEAKFGTALSTFGTVG